MTLGLIGLRRIVYCLPFAKRLLALGVEVVREILSVH